MTAAPTALTPAIARLFWLWLVGRTAAWWLLVSTTQPNPPLDLIEWLSWGRAWAWGYPKHPPLAAWIAERVESLTPGNIDGIYLAGYLITAIALWSVWRLGLEFLDPRYALLGAMAMDGLFYLTNDAAEFNNQVVLNACWALTLTSFLLALRTNAWRWWLTLGVAVGAGLLCKYTLGMLLLPLAGFMLWDPAARRYFLKPGPYIALAIAALIFAPHAVWMVQNDFLTLRYAAERSASQGQWDRLKHPATFLASQLALLLPVLAVVVPACGGRRNALPADRAVLHWAIPGPVLLHLALSLATGCQLRHIWGSALWSFAGMYMLVLFGAADASRWRYGVRAWAVVAVGVMGLVTFRNVAMPLWTHKPGRIHYPGRALADEVNRRWAEQSDRPFAIAAGEGWRAGNVCCFSKHHPIAYSSGSTGGLEFDERHVLWTNDADLIARGGVIVWPALELGDELPAAVRKRFPGAVVQPAIVLPYQTSAEIPPDRVGLAFVRPAK